MADEIALFSVEEANALLPHIHDVISELRDMRDRAQSIKDKQEVLHLLHGDGLTLPTNPDHREWTALGAEAETVARNFNALVAGVHDTGFLLKDIDHGLVDFYHERNGEIVFLCWREGESRLQYWHPLSTGIAGRQPLGDAEILDNETE